MVLLITTITVSLSALLGLYLAYLTVVARKRSKIGVGSGDDHALQLRIRSHGNLVEYAVFALPLLGLLEQNQAPQWLVALLALLWLSGRVLHPWGLIAGEGKYHVGRFSGTLLTWFSIAALAIANVVMVLL
ncbi:MAPEG family protein [uncultured Ferrimonas sp.]|uniref:MAPEG family protein n=1 Tax=uncultured Ferrimonas sp. TaxID=432640 RepID=UPI0026130384|nr:MAPEG family protein [uncultured Ferrimonas sp.]